MPDRNGKIFYTSITSLSHISKKGWREAELLADRMSKETIDYFYVSPLGRARDTASCTLKKTGRTAEVCPWLREFEAPIWRPDVKDHRKIPWDWMPADWTGDDRAYRRDQWFEMEPLAEGNVKQEYDRVTGEFDRLLERHGYRRQGGYYQAVCPNRDTLALFCHFGVECVLLSHLMGASPMVLWHGLCALPTGVTTVVTEERQQGIASFRIIGFGDLSHLYAAGEAPSFAARFCECYDSPEERH